MKFCKFFAQFSSEFSEYIYNVKSAYSSVVSYLLNCEVVRSDVPSVFLCFETSNCQSAACQLYTL